METRILGISGKKQSGKNSAANGIVGFWLTQLEITESYSITQDGKLWISDIFGDKSLGGVLALDKQSQFLEEYVHPFVKLYSYADTLKRTCIDVLGLTYTQCYGSDEDKNTNTHLNWEDMPGIYYENERAYAANLEADPTLENILIHHKPGPMTAREVMQFVGTEIFRKMYGNVWVDATLRNIAKDNPAMAIITDVRFPNEVAGVQQKHGKVIRLNRNVLTDEHASEKSLDDFTDFDSVIDNQELNCHETNELVKSYLNQISWLPRPISDYEG